MGERTRIDGEEKIMEENEEREKRDTKKRRGEEKRREDAFELFYLTSSGWLVRDFHPPNRLHSD